jgi:soluble lytic murein transglycosylase
LNLKKFTRIFFETGKSRAVCKGAAPFFWRACFLFVFLFLILPSLRGRSAPAPLPDVLREWRAVAGTHAGMLDALKMSIEHYDGKRYADTLAALAGVRDAEKSLFGDYVLLYRAKAGMELKRHSAALEHFRLLEKHFPDSPHLREAVMGQCRALLEMNESGPVKSLLKKYGQYTGAEPMYYNARALHLEGNKEEALALYLQVYSKYPSSSFSSPSYQHILKLSPNAFDGARNYLIRLERAENRIRERNYSAANTLLTALGEVSAPDGKTAQRRNLLRAEAEFNLNRTSAAVAILEKFKTDDPDMHARALYLEGASRRRLKQETAFVALRDRALKLYPRSSDTEELCYSVATYYDVNYEQRKASDAYKVLVQAFPKGRHAERAQWKVALTAWFEGNYPIAASEFRDYIISNPDPVDAGSGIYWLGRCYAKIGAVEEARYLYRRARALIGDGYYGLRAREAEEDLKSVKSSAGSAVFPIGFSEIQKLCDGIQLPDVEAIANPDAAGMEILRRAEHLAAARLESFAIAELRRGAEQYPQNRRAFNYVMAKISAGRENFYEAISTLRRVFLNYNSLGWNDLPEETWDLFYPTLYGDIVAKHAKNAGLDLPLILGLIRQESAFNARARSSANARGLMQLLPGTARETAASAKMTRAQAENLYNPEINIRLGTAYFNSMLRQHGRVELALGAYNAGGSRIKRWVSEFGDDDMAGFVEQIPFAETRNYVKTVLGNAEHYRRLLKARNESP